MTTNFYYIIERELRQRKFNPDTITSYVDNVRSFAEYYYPCHPRELRETDVRNYLLYLQNTKLLSADVVNQSFKALQFLYNELYKSPLHFRTVPSSRKHRLTGRSPRTR